MRRSLLLSLILLLFHAGGRSQWVQTGGPEGGLVVALALNQSTNHLYAGTKGGVYRSDDGGATWIWLANGIPASYAVTALYSTGSHTYVFGATPQTLGELYYSTNEGATWTQMAATGLPTLGLINCFIAVGSDLLAGVNGPLGGSGVYRSTDNGASWTISSGGLPANFSPGAFGVSGSALFSGGHINAPVKGAYLSTDGGANWSGVNTNFPSTAGVTAFTTIGSSVFAATLNGGVFRTTDNGAGWTKISPTTPVVILGATALAATASNLYIGTGGAVYRADATGAGWDTVTVGLPRRDAGSSTGALAISGSNLLASCSNLGIWRSTNDGASWAKSSAGLRSGRTWGLMTDGSTLYASGVPTGFFRSSSDGDGWVETNNGVNLLNNGYYGFAVSGGILVGGSGIGGYRSTDQGDSWSQPSPDLAGPIYTMVVDGADLYAAGQGVVARSTNNGGNWSILPTGLLSYQAVFALWKSGATMLAGTSVGGVKRSTDNGASWTAPISGLPALAGYHAFSEIGAMLFTTYAGGVYRSSDGGATWALSNSGVAGAPWALHTHGTDLYVGTNQGVYRSTNLGTSWTGINTGLPAQPAVTTLASNDRYLFAGLDPNSVWRRPLSEVTSAGTPDDQLPHRYSLGQNFPNPFNPATTINFDLPAAGEVRIAVYDLLGREIAVLVQEKKPAGSHSVRFDGAGFASGVYFYRLDAGNFSRVRRMVLLQ